MPIIGNQQTKSVKTIIIIFLARVICFFLSMPRAWDMVLLMLKYMMVYPNPITMNPTKLNPIKRAVAYSHPEIGNINKHLMWNRKGSCERVELDTTRIYQILL